MNAGGETVVLYNPATEQATMPLALLAVGSAVERTRFDVRIVDGRLHADPVAALLDAVDDDTLCVGVTVLTGAPIRNALEVSRAVKAARPDVPVVWGGWHPSLFPVSTLEEPSVDVTVQAQGEDTFRELVARLADGDGYEGLPGTATRSGPHPPRPLADMDGLPPADYGLIDVEPYFRRKPRRQLDYVSSTGCRFRCAFCADPFVFGRSWTAISPERVGDELHHWWRRYRFDDVNFQDETFFTSTDRVVAIAEEFLRRGPRFSWAGTLRADQAWRLDEEALATCVRSGLRRVMIGVESGSAETLERIKKDITIEQVMVAAERCSRYGIAVTFPFIVGFPREPRSSVEATLRLARRLRVMDPAFETPIFFYKPYPGSELTDDVAAEGYDLPSGLEEWATFDYVDGAAGPWVEPTLAGRVDRFRFYNRIAGGVRPWYRRPLQAVARWRCDHDEFRFPVEQRVVERLRPQRELT